MCVLMFVIAYLTSIILTLKVYRVNTVTKSSPQIAMLSSKTSTVVCYDFNGVKKWCYRNDLLKEPKGITVDSNSNIYVAGCNSHNVVVISPDGNVIPYM
jgi:DNA-binding beta-propeller fold protein YncE